MWDKSELIFFVNGKKIVEENPDPEWTLLYYLRNKLRLCGTKLGCAEGGCGACTVMVSKYDRKQQRVVHIPVNACLAPVCSMHGLAVTTVEGIGSTKTRLHPVQERIAKSHGSQCGFCTPGIVMSMYTLLRNMEKPSMKDLDVAFQGNLCRCTGYRPIIEAYKTFTEDWELRQSYVNGSKGCGMGDQCCKVRKGTLGLNGSMQDDFSGSGGQNSSSKGEGCSSEGSSQDDSSIGDACKANGKEDSFKGHEEDFFKGHEEYSIENGLENSSNACGQKDKYCKMNDDKFLNVCGQEDKFSKLLNGSSDKCCLKACDQKDCKVVKVKLTSNGCTGKSEDKLSCNGSGKLFMPSEFIPFDGTQEPIFPPELKVSEVLDCKNLHFVGRNVSWYRPTCMDSLLQLKSEKPDSKLVAGNTEIGVEVKFKQQLYPVLIQIGYVPVLTECKILNDGLLIGAAVTLDDLEKLLKAQITTKPEGETRIFKAIVEMLHWFAGKQIRSVASVGGNIVTGSPISDLNPIFMAAKVELTLRSISGCRTVLLDDQFFTGYRRNVLRKDEILVSIKIPYTRSNQFFFAYKQARRRDDDIAIVNCAIDVILNDSVIVEDVVCAFGGLAATTVTAKSVAKKIRGHPWDERILEMVNTSLMEDLYLPGDAPGGMIGYRKTLPMSFFFRAFIAIFKELRCDQLDPRDLSAVNAFDYKTPKSAQFFQVVPKAPEKFDPVGQPIVHMSAYKQASGEAIYFDDIPRLADELYLALVYSKKAHANIISIDYSKALELQGVVGYVDHKDLKEGTKIGCIVQDEEVFVSKTVNSQGVIIGGIVAEDQLVAKRAAQMVEVRYEELTPIIVSIEDAIVHESFFPSTRKLNYGDVEEAFGICKYVLEGECRTGYQEHFYLETHGCLVVPREDEFEIYSSTQHHSEITDYVARILGIPQNKVVTKVKRIGGGFGGKQSRGLSLAAPAAVAANKFGRPVRIMLDRDEDMALTGGRHPYVTRYKVGFDDTGRITAYDALLYANGGYSNDLSVEVLERAVFHIENTYKIQNLRVEGKICKTNLPTNTAFRGFGAPQSMFAAENAVRDVAEFLGIDTVEVALKNLYQEGDITHYNQILENCNLRKCIEECLESSRYRERQAEIETYNRKNRWKKRGISMVPTKYGVGFGVPFLEQAGALVLIYTDGSVLITHSGVEMGQGLNTKMIQVASRVLEISTDKIHIAECATDKVPNSSPTAASVGSDLNGIAVLRACTTLKERLTPIVVRNPKGTWEDWIKAAYFQRISLSATGYFCTPDIEYDWENNKGKPYNYFTFGAACTEVEIDCLTGDHQVLRTDIVMDIGCSLNPAIDIGQIEGGFMQGYGLFVLEEMVYSPTGTIYSRGPGTYKIPGFNDIPVEFNVSLLKGVSNPRAVYSSKAVGEPPLFLASSSLFAIREAIKSAREESGVSKSFRLNAPATAEKIRMACEDDLTLKATKTKDDRTPWNVVP